MTEAFGGSPDNETKPENEYHARQAFAEGHAHTEVLRTAVERPLILHAGREIVSMFEDTLFNPESPFSKYPLESVLATIMDRESAMSLGIRELVDLGIIQANGFNYDKKTARFNYPGFEYKRIQEMKSVVSGQTVDKQTGRVLRENISLQPVEELVVGSDEQRNELCEHLKRVRGEIMAREGIVGMLRWVWGQTENIEGLVKFYFMNSLTAEAMNTLCNAEGRKNGLTKTEGGVNYRAGNEFGDAMGVALQCFEVAALSESPHELADILKRPGARFLFDVTDQEVNDIFLKPSERSGRSLNAKLVEWIGEPWKWKQGVRDGRGDIEEEQDDRGYLTKRGNILVGTEDWKDDIEYVCNQVERFIGGGAQASIFPKKEAKEARFVAWGILRTTGMASDYGKQLYHRKANPAMGLKEGNYYFHDMGQMTSCDRAKVFYPNIFRNIYRYLKSETRDYGPEGSMGKYPDRFTVQYFKNWNIDVNKKWSKDGLNHGKRTFQEMRWGYRADNDGPEEPAYRLGELPWGRLSPKAFNGAALGPFIAGREDKGLYQWMMRTEWKDISMFKEASYWNMLAKHLGITCNEQTVFNGKFRGLYNGVKENDEKAKDQAKRSVRNYKRQYLLAFWDGLRSLPQWREWLALNMDQVKNTSKAGDRSSRHPVKRVKYRIGKLGLFSMEEAMSLPENATNTEEFA